MAWTNVDWERKQSAVSGTSLSADGTINIAAGDLLVGVFAWEGATGDGPGCRTGVGENDFTMLTPTLHSVTGKCMVMGYKIGATANATATLEFTLSTTAANRSFQVFLVRPAADATVTFEDDAGNAEIGYVATFETNELSVVGSDIITFCGVENYSGRSLTTMTIETVDCEDAYIDAGETFLGFATFTANQSAITGAGELSGGTRMLVNLIGFNASGAAPPTDFTDEIGIQIQF